MPPKKKRKIDPNHKYFDLTQEIEKYPDGLQQILSSLGEMSKTPHLHPAVGSMLESLKYAVSPSTPEPIALQASKISLVDTKNYLDIQFVRGSEDYRWSLKDGHQQPIKPL